MTPTDVHHLAYHRCRDFVIAYGKQPRAHERKCYDPDGAWYKIMVFIDDKFSFNCLRFYQKLDGKFKISVYMNPNKLDEFFDLAPDDADFASLRAPESVLVTPSDLVRLDEWLNKLEQFQATSDTSGGSRV